MTSAPPSPVEHRLSDAEACDLDLLLAGALPSGSVLGATLSSGLPVRTATDLTARLQVPADEGRRMAAAGWTVLADDESTPVAELQDVQVEEPGDRAEGRTDARALVVGRVLAGRPRASGPLPGLSLALQDERSHGRDVLLMGRPPMLADDDALHGWAQTAGPRPLVLVPEGGDGRALPAATLVRLAQVLVDRLRLVDAEVRVAPLHLREADDDHRRAELLVATLSARHVLLLSSGRSDPRGRAWQEAHEELWRGTEQRPLPGVDPEVEGVLRRRVPRRPERGLVVLMTGLSGSGKSTLARDLTTHLARTSARRTTLLDGDSVRRLLSSGLGFDRRSRELNVLRLGWVAARVAEHGGTAVCSPIAPFDATRREVRAMVEQVADLVLVHVSTPLEECERRDLKGLYARARRGEIPDFTGISSPYEEPTDADVVVDTSQASRADGVETVLEHLRSEGWLTVT